VRGRHSMSHVVIVYGPMGSGKTTTCVELAERARSEVTVTGIITKRVFRGEEVVGYDCVDLSTSEAFPLVRLARDMDDPDWLPLYLEKFVFSTSGFRRANEILKTSVVSFGQPRLILVDEYGRLEERGIGLIRGVEGVLDALRGIDVAVVTCRDNLLSHVEEMARRAGHEVHVCQPGDSAELWPHIGEALGVDEELK
jgi:nucleoside-triphosphatase THEP1